MAEKISDVIELRISAGHKKNRQADTILLAQQITLGGKDVLSKL